MADKLEAMSVLLAVVDAGGFSAAARRLGQPLATVSRKVGDLEAQLGVRLLQRSTRHVSLTDVGRSYVDACRRILEEVSEAERAAVGEYRSPKGDLVMTAPLVFGRLHVVPVVSDFLKTYPQISVRLLLLDRITHLLEEHIDLALRIGPLPDSSMVAIGVGEVRQVICASPGYLAARGVPATPADLAGHDCVTYEGLVSPLAWSFGREKDQISVPVRSRLVVNGAEAAIDAAAAGVGLTRVLSYQCAEAVKAGRLVQVLDEHASKPWPVSLVYSSQGALPLKLRAFLDFAGPRLREHLRGLA